jgi:hypothetical protein
MRRLKKHQVEWMRSQISVNIPVCSNYHLKVIESCLLGWAKNDKQSTRLELLIRWRALQSEPHGARSQWMDVFTNENVLWPSQLYCHWMLKSSKYQGTSFSPSPPLWVPLQPSHNIECLSVMKVLYYPVCVTLIPCLWPHPQNSEVWCQGIWVLDLVMLKGLPVPPNTH